MDVDRLMKIIKEKGLNVEQIAKKVGMHRSTFYRRIKKKKFLIGEALIIVEVLKLTKKEAREIFLLM